MRNDSSVKNIRVDKIVMAGAVTLMAYFAGDIIVANRGEITLGFIFRFAVYMVPFMLAISLLRAGDFLGSLDFRISDVRFTHIVLSFIAALLTYPIVIYFIGMPHPLALFLSLIILISVFIALYYALSGKVFHGIIIYILTQPFTTFLLWALAYNPEMFKVGVFNLHPSSVFMLSLFLIWIAGLMLKREPLIKHPALIAFLLFICWGGIAVLFSQDISKSLSTWISEYFFPILLFLLLINSVRTQKQILILLYSLIYLSIFTVFFEFYFTLGAQQQLDIEALHAINLFWAGRGALVLLAIPLNICLIRTVSKKMRIPILLSLVFLIIFLILDNTRTAILAFFVSIVVFVNSRKYGSVIVVMALAAVIFWNYGINLIFERFKVFEFTAQGLSMKTWSPMRYEGLIAAIGMIKEFPLLGIGPGMWDEYFYRYGAPIIYATGPVYITAAHNGYLDYAAQMGLPGLILWLSFLFLIFKTCIKIIKNTKLILKRNIALGCLGSLIALCVGSFGGAFQFSTNGNLSVGIIMLGIVSIPIVLDRSEQQLLEK